VRPTTCGGTSVFHVVTWISGDVYAKNEVPPRGLFLKTVFLKAQEVDNSRGGGVTP